MAKTLGKLHFQLAAETTNLLGGPVNGFLQAHNHDDIWAVEIDPSLADTAAFCEAYDIGLDISANCVIVEAKRGDKIWYAACMILATHKVDVNGVVRKTLEARKASFASMDMATALTGMEYGGITPVGLPAEWPILIDRHVVEREQLIIGSGIRGSKILITAKKLQQLPNARVLDIAK